jgi:hypothetical protein
VGGGSSPRCCTCQLVLLALLLSLHLLRIHQARLTTCLPFVQYCRHYGVRYDRQRKLLSLYMSCEGVRFRFLCGANTCASTWDPPSRRRLQTPDQAVMTDEDGAQEAPRPGSPPPPFLVQLSAESGAGTVRQDMVRTMRQTGDAMQSDSPGPAAEGIAAVTAALKALDKGLFDKLA